MHHAIELTIDNQIATLCVNRPQARNALNWAAQRAFAAAVAQVAADPTLRALIITARGDSFVSGGDLKDHVGADSAHGEQLQAIMGDALAALTRLPIPVLAAINGDAYGGGCEIITACDLRLMAAGARLHFVQARMGLTTGWGGGPRLVRLVGAAHALDLLLTARPVDAAHAQAIGLVQRIVPAGADVLAAAHDWAAELATLPANALAALKQLVYRSTDPASGAAAERELFAAAWQHPNHWEAVAAFVARRPPRFDDRPAHDAVQ